MEEMDKLSRDELIDLIKDLEEKNTILKKRKKYGLVWEEKEEEVVKLCATNFPIVKQNNKCDVVSDKKMPANILIEGDNYHSLSVLNYTHPNSFDLIYIDPPYNTGSKDFKYNDDFVEKDDAYRHSKWLSFMEKRLRLAKNLLNEDGSIYLSINEEELAHLKILCDEIFGYDNYLTTFTIKVRHEDRILKGDKDFHEVVEYLLYYRKNSKFKPKKRSKDNTSLDEYVWEVQTNKKPDEMIKMGRKEVGVFHPGSYKIVEGKPGSNKLKRINIRGSIKEGNSSGRFYVKYLEAMAAKNPAYLFSVPDMGADKSPNRYFLTPKGKRVNGDYFQGVPLNRKDELEIPYPNYLDFEKEFNQVGYEGGIEFRNGKKPVSFLHKLFDISGIGDKPDAKVLDFFAGSGTTGHAVMEYNKINGGDRTFVMCTNNEGNICKGVTYKRISNVVKGYSPKRGGKVKGIGGHVKYFITDLLDGGLSRDENRMRMAEACDGMLCLKESIFDLSKKTKHYSVFENGDRVLAVYHALDQSYLPQLKQILDKFNTEKILYCFTLDSYGLDGDMFEGWEGVVLKPIPQKILDVYESIYESIS